MFSLRALKWSKILLNYFEIYHDQIAFQSAAFLLIRVVFVSLSIRCSLM